MNKSIAFTIHSEENGIVKQIVSVNWNDLVDESKEIINVTIGKSLRCWQGTARQERMVRTHCSETSCTYYHVVENYNNDVFCYEYAESTNQEEILIFDLEKRRVRRVRINMKNSRYGKKETKYERKNKRVFGLCEK